MNYYEALQKLKDGSLPPCLILEGPEPYLTEDFLDKLTRKLIPEGSESLNLTRLEGGEVDLEPCSLPWGHCRCLATTG